MKKISLFSLLVAIAIVSALPEKLQANGDSPVRIYVDRNVISNGNGESWQTAFRYLQDAISHSVGGRGDEIWIAAGTYYPDEGIGLTKGDRMLSFQFPSGTKVYGSFSGSETSSADRNSSNPRTILSGVISEDVNLRSQNVCTITDEASFDGIDITGGNANSGTVYDKVNGAIMPKRTTGNTPTLLLRDCFFYDNRASQANGVTGDVVLTAIGCSFINNSAGWGSGVGGGDPLWTLINCIFEGNSAGHGGVGYWGHRIAINCVFVGNRASRGAVFGGAGTAQFINCTFAGNSGNPIFGGSYYTLQIYAANSIFWDENIFTTVGNFRPTHFSNIINDTAINPSGLRAPNIVQGGPSALALPNTENIAPDNNYGDASLVVNLNPAFVNFGTPSGNDGNFGTSDDGLRLESTSAAIGIAIQSLLPTDVYDLDGDSNVNETLPLDLKSSTRTQGGGLDLGAYEHNTITPEPTPSPTPEPTPTPTPSPTSDLDQDGVIYYRELKDGTNPNDPTSFNPLSKGLVAYFPFANTPDDESGFNHAVEFNGIQPIPPPSNAPLPSYEFAGDTNAFHLTSGIPVPVDNSYSWSLWIQPSTLKPRNFLVSRIQGLGLNESTPWLEVTDSGQLRFARSASDEPQFRLHSPEGVVQVGSWAHVAATSDSNGKRQLFVNGIAVADGMDIQYGTELPMLLIGADRFLTYHPTHGSGSNGSFQGQISEVRVYDRALSEAEVAQLYVKDVGCSDSDMNGLSDAADFLALFSTQVRSRGQTDVTTNPSAFSLFTQSQFNGNRTAGQQDVINSPMSYGLYTSDSIMDLHMGGLMIQKSGNNAVVSFQPQTTTDLTQSFTNNGTPITNTIPMPGNKGFIRINAKP